MFLSAIETTIVATSLIQITNHFHEYNRANWIVAAYLLTYNGFLLLFSKFCDIFGYKTMLLAANVCLGVFSILCGVAQSMNQLYVLLWNLQAYSRTDWTELYFELSKELADLVFIV